MALPHVATAPFLVDVRACFPLCARAAGGGLLPFSWLSWALRPGLPVLLFSLMWSVSQRLALVFRFTSKDNMACHVPGTHSIATWEAGTQSKVYIHSFTEGTWVL